MGFGEVGRAVGRYGVRTLAWLFVVVGPATDGTVPPIDQARRPGIERPNNQLGDQPSDRLSDRHGADGSDPEHDDTTPPPAPGG